MKSSDYYFTGILSNKKELNPSFYNWNRFVMRYCDGSSFTGDIEAVDPATNLHLRGARVFNVIIEELLRKGMKSASNALLSGSSAGGLASILHCDKFKAIFPSSTRVKCFSDAGYFAHVSEFLDAFLVAQNGSSTRGWFVNNCFTHGQCEYQTKWLGNGSSKLNHMVKISVFDVFLSSSSFLSS
ncbi:hypothetical protein L1987_72254 [Smallanthus sonchifolius]|uniref:Uncharacterized protein n=1 Tax=Smallanthus sonchifolius TaxID=185202 RepID=A0ACB9AVD8_9ASTR|nr:hypothetical protein L1987_72254 [Smallanthus sonchifolius]